MSAVIDYTRQEPYSYRLYTNDTLSIVQPSIHHVATAAITKGDFTNRGEGEQSLNFYHPSQQGMKGGSRNIISMQFFPDTRPTSTASRARRYEACRRP